MEKKKKQSPISVCIGCRKLVLIPLTHIKTTHKNSKKNNTGLCRIGSLYKILFKILSLNIFSLGSLMKYKIQNSIYTSNMTKLNEKK